MNGVKYTDLKFGWGPENGHVYQKAYYEFFVHPSVLTPLIHHLEQHPDISYQAINSKGEKFQNIADNEVNAVTWGVFRGREII